MNYKADFGEIKGFEKFFIHFRLLFLIWLLILSSFALIGARIPTPGDDENSLVYAEIPVRVMVEGYETFFMDAIYTDKKELYIDIADLFAKLNIPCQSGQDRNTLSGFIGSESRNYLIDREKYLIKIDDKVIQSTTGILKEKEILYIESSLVSEAFGIILDFSHRALSIQLKSNFELPIIKQQRIEKMRKNLMKIKGEVMADTLVQRNYHLMKFGTLDWAFASTQTFNAPTSKHFALGLGTEFLYGETDISVNYYDQQKFDNRQLYYQWRWVDNNKKLIRQAQLGTISTQTISFINAPLVGATIRNTPTTVRKASGYYNITEYTEPNRSIELYINNVLVDFTKADASGLYVFKVPVVYGYSTLKLKIYGPMGEESIIERTINMPYTIMPVKELEYGLSAGIVEDSHSSRFGRGEFNYGVNRFLTVGGGIEYLSSISNGTYIPFLTATIQPFSQLTLNAEYAQGVKTRGLLNYYIRKDILLELEYTKYKEGQLACIMNAPEERKARISIPFAFKSINGFAKLDFTQMVYQKFKYNQSSVLFSVYYKQVNINSTTQLNRIDQRTPYVISDLALSYRFGKGYTLRPSTQYNVNSNTFSTYRIALEKYIPFGKILLSYEKNIPTNTNLFNISFQYDLPFARTNLSVTQYNHTGSNSETHQKGATVISESAQGSLAFGRGNKYVYKSNNTSISRGGISFYPFLDLNHNGKYEKGEPLVKLTTFRMMGSKAIISEKDSILSIPDLMAFTWFTIEFRDTDLENISWRFKRHIYKILVDPNQFKHVDVPIVPVGEIEGMIYLNTENRLKGIGKILVNFYDKLTHKKIGETLSESDGYISYFGLDPGEYIARIDTLQLNNLNYTALPKQRDFTVKTAKEGDIVNGLNFVLNPSSDLTNFASNTDSLLQINQPDIAEVINTIRNIGRKYSSVTPSKDRKASDSKMLPATTHQFKFFNNNLVMNTRDTMIYLPGKVLYEVHLCSYSKPITSKDFFISLLTALPAIKIIETPGKNGFYHYSTGTFMYEDEAGEYLRFIKSLGWKNGYVSIFTGGKCKVISFSIKKPDL